LLVAADTQKRLADKQLELDRVLGSASDREQAIVKVSWVLNGKVG